MPDSCVPIGIKIDDSSTKLMPIPPGPALLHHLLAVTFAENPDEEVLQSNIAGYVCVYVLYLLIYEKLSEFYPLQQGWFLKI